MYLSKTIQIFPNLQFGYTEKKPVLLAATIKIVPLPRKRNQLLLLSKGGGSGSVGFFSWHQENGHFKISK